MILDLNDHQYKIKMNLQLKELQRANSNMDGDYLFYFTSDKDADKNNEGNTLAKEWTEDPLFKQLQASKDNKVFQVDEVIWNTAGGSCKSYVR